MPTPGLPANVVSLIQVSPRQGRAEIVDAELLKRWRAEEFETGNQLAQQAIRQLMFPQTPLNLRVDRNPDRSPKWPAGFVGSIAHSDHWIWAVVGRNDDFLSIGIDTEPIVDQAKANELSCAVGDRDEWNLLASLGADCAERHSFTLLFSAKEAFFKMCYPLTKSMWDFHDVRLASIERIEDWDDQESSSILTRQFFLCCRASQPPRDSEVDLRVPHPVTVEMTATDVFSFGLLPARS